MLGNNESKIFKAVNQLECRKRVGATGTPLQNDYFNLQSLFQFLGLKPWSNGDVFDKVGFPQEFRPGFVPAY
jgi:SNF2 family DNA or RNA helicase